MRPFCIRIATSMSLHLFDTWTLGARVRTVEGGRGRALYVRTDRLQLRAHIGNLRTCFEDGLVRTLKLNGYRVNHVMNITDVGHLVSDADQSEDKMEAGSRRTGQKRMDNCRALYRRISLQT